MANVRIPILDGDGVPLRNLVADRAAMFLRLLGEHRPDLKEAADEIADDLESVRTLLLGVEPGELVVTMTREEYREIWGSLPEEPGVDFTEDRADG